MFLLSPLLSRIRPPHTHKNIDTGFFFLCPAARPRSDHTYNHKIHAHTSHSLVRTGTLGSHHRLCKQTGTMCVFAMLRNALDTCYHRSVLRLGPVVYYAVVTSHPHPQTQTSRCVVVLLRWSSVSVSHVVFAPPHRTENVDMQKSLIRPHTHTETLSSHNGALPHFRSGAVSDFHVDVVIVVGCRRRLCRPHRFCIGATNAIRQFIIRRGVWRQRKASSSVRNMCAHVSIWMIPLNTVRQFNSRTFDI